MNMVSRHAYSLAAGAGSRSATRARIVGAALKLALEQAYEEITLTGIAEAAGVSHQTVLNQRRAIHALHAATDAYTWKPLRRDLRLSRTETEPIMLELFDRVLAGGRRRARRQRSREAAR